MRGTKEPVNAKRFLYDLVDRGTETEDIVEIFKRLGFNATYRNINAPASTHRALRERQASSERRVSPDRPTTKPASSSWLKSISAAAHWGV